MDQVATAKIINAWIETNTHGMIKDMIGPESFSPSTKMALANAVYFKGNLRSLLKGLSFFRCMDVKV